MRIALVWLALISMGAGSQALAQHAPKTPANRCGALVDPKAGFPHVIVLSAPSGGGKTTLAQLLLKDYKNLSVSISSTTRAPRGAEKDGVDYRFLTAEQFKAKVARGDFAEWAEVHGNFYGTDASVIQGELSSGRSVMALLDTEGAKKIKERFPGQVYTVFIQPPSMAELEARLRGRGTDTEEAIQKRLAGARKEMAEAGNYDSILINDDLGKAHEAFVRLILENRLVP